MPTLTLKMRWPKFDGTNNSLVLSPSELVEQFFHGIDLCDQQGNDLPVDTIRRKIRAAQETLEQALGLKFWKQIYSERRDFILDQWKQWGFLHVTFPIRDVCALNGHLGGINQVEYPIEWISLQNQTDERYFWRTINLVPSGASVEFGTGSVVAVGITPHAGFLGLANIPNYWTVEYLTGFNQVPSELLEVIGKLASIPIFAILGDIVLGAGIASLGISYDGLSEQVNTTNSAENSAYSARVRQYERELKDGMKSLKGFYSGIEHIVI